MHLNLKTTAAALLAASLAGCVGSATGTTQDTEITHAGSDRSEALRQVNAWRAQHSLPALEQNSQLEAVSQDMADHIASRDSLQTPRHSGSSLSSRLRTKGYQYAAAGENLGAGQSNVTDVINGWKNSRGHNRNLLNPNVTQMGIARTRRADGTYHNFWVITLGSPRPPASATDAPPGTLPVPFL